MNIGICGLGVVGSAISHFFQNARNRVQLCLYDKYKTEINDFKVLLQTDILFVCLPTPFNEGTQTYNTDELHELFERLHSASYKGDILLKSTVDPEFCATLNNTYPSLLLIHNPEFLTARYALEDFRTQQHVVLGSTVQSAHRLPILAGLHSSWFPHPITISLTEAKYSSLMKIACNAFYATKIQFFNELYQLCQATGMEYTTVQKLMTTTNEWLPLMHTHVPGPDGQLSFGGACLPKDTAALLALCRRQAIEAPVIDATLEEQRAMRQEQRAMRKA